MENAVNNLISIIKNEGYNKTALSGVGVYKTSQSTDRIPLCYNQGIIIILQGQKRVFFDQKTYRYNPDNYLVLTLPLPAECETTIEDGKPLISLIIDLDLAMLNELVRVLDEHGQIKQTGAAIENKGLYVSQCTTMLSCTITRLTQCLKSPLQCEIIGKGLLREIFFHILSGPQSAPLFALVSHNTHLAKMERILKHLHNNFQHHLDVAQLASMANMSSSTFHRNFKQITASSPIQYVKKIRLNRARELLQDQGLKVKQAAAQVGYESPTQFSREFTRYYGLSPSECAKAMV
ncbi:AraC family transcriptional regulator [Pseudoalteromonas sp. NBT06-2]|uniref:AraC family transcriptional regulator n=1 Tax=Pseudoalteromonas sp. NBT06-2 TaxID=2025950 RepID=UPI000BA4EC62|nr:AraC family transcriptional regulator [Pseudoalteromonas sp. NBT06-2]PAJ73360.1 AraC family transcriptional regulator [Pseudoalteromonas sp. NBT06-2]